MALGVAIMALIFMVVVLAIDEHSEHINRPKREQAIKRWKQSQRRKGG